MRRLPGLHSLRGLGRAVLAGRLLGAALGAVLVCAALGAAGCGTGRAGTFHPAGAAAPGTPAAAGPAKSRLREGVAWPPFGSNARVIMPTWLPPDAHEVPAVITAKDFLLAYLYAQYRGNQDQRWTAYVRGGVRASMQASLAQPDVTSESFSGTIRFSLMRAFPDPIVPGDVDVSECFDNSRSVNTNLKTGKAVPGTTPPNEHYYRNTDVLAPGKDGRWHVVSVYPVIYYPQAKECKP